ncbi:DUF2273 domain-containing protein [Corynebacterium striatum]|uniref:DUF2273 domain-containing protein n=1 Tax=Corynebacterium striatum TaxID=43770 RepID=A0AAN5HUV7_CORST|nr:MULTISPECIES: DUF2273 domain-containing protein [Corynebacterium]ATZ06187.1 DUF2273 domain-containing protein [Corynebacterium striatum]ATZ09417.1 DUF2273 domain-containing protein [Corynebacterium striatum]EEI78243.1 hypothetical protein HMPREF0308_1491 [Corynebacterium striatum ATCC 6940]EGT5576471.1 DUF2273 domain-containing protein [Corynebacterium striatum]EGT5592827.1 DUF2273 domain-containing protein [Corynebacterium striatum]
MKNYSTLGIVAGLVLAFFIHLGLWPTVLAVLLAALGGVIGAHFDGRIDLSAVWNGIVGKDKGQG